MCRRLALAREKPERLLNTTIASIDRFLCRALRGEAAPWDELPANIAPDVVIDRCQHHGISALLLHSRRGREEWLSWPLDLQNALQEASKAAVAVELLRSHHLQKLLQSFSAAGIRFLLTKGAALARTHYPVPGTRTRCDSDLFIDICEIENARQAILDEGLRIVSAIYKTHQFTARLMQGDAGGLEFDVHWRILNSARFARTISFDEAWAESVELPEMHGVRTLCPTHALMLACMHRVGSEWHDQDRLIWIYDIHLLVSAMSRPELLVFADNAVALNIQAACRNGLAKSVRYFATRVPDDITCTLETPELRHRFAYSNLGLLVDDWKCLASGGARRRLLGEIFAPSSNDLMSKYGKQDHKWLPWLYLRHLLAGVAQRLALR